MTQAKRKDYTMEELEESYHQITALYDHASELVETVESRLTADPDLQLALVEPLINEVGDATDVLTEQYLHLADGARRGGTGKASKSLIEASMRRIYAAIADYRERVQAAGRGAVNIADIIVAKIQRQVEKVIAIFLDFIQLSLAHIMGKAELDAIRQRESRVALMLHQMSLMGQQQ